MGLEGEVLAYKRLFRKRRCSEFGKTTETRLAQATKDERDGSSKTEVVPEQNTRRGGSVNNTKKESRRTCLMGSGTCPLSVRGSFSQTQG